MKDEMKRNMVMFNRHLCGCGPCVVEYHRDKKSKARKRRARRIMKIYYGKVRQ